MLADDVNDHGWRTTVGITEIRFGFFVLGFVLMMFGALFGLIQFLGSGASSFAIFALPLFAAGWYAARNTPRRIEVTQTYLTVYGYFDAHIAQHSIACREEREECMRWLERTARELKSFRGEGLHGAAWAWSLKPALLLSIASGIGELEMNSSESEFRFLSVPLSTGVIRLAADGLALQLKGRPHRFYSWSEIEDAPVDQRAPTLILANGEQVRLGHPDPLFDFGERSRAYARGASLDEWIRSATRYARAQKAKEPAKESTGYRTQRLSPLSIARDVTRPIRARVDALQRVGPGAGVMKELASIAEATAAPQVRAAVDECRKRCCEAMSS